MGCTQQRIEENNSQTQITIKEKKITDTTPSTSQDTLALLDTLNLCILNRDFTEILCFLGDFSRQYQINSYPRWASEPSIKASAALALLNRKLKHSKVKFQTQILLQKLQKIIQALTSEVEDYQQHSVFFLHQVLKTAQPIFVASLLNQQIFKKLIPLLVDSNSDFRFCVARVCQLIYHSSIEARKQFIEANGMTLLLQQIQLGIFSRQVLRDQLKCIYTLLVYQRVPIQQNIRILDRLLNRNQTIKLYSLVRNDEAGKILDSIINLIIK